MIHNIKILIVEDEAIIGLYIKKILKKFNFKNVYTIEKYNDAIKYFKNYKPNLILMDINLGEKNKTGIDLSLTIQKIYPTPIIFISAYNDEKTISNISHLNTYGFLCKPINENDLKSTIFLATNRIYNKLNKEVIIKNDYKYSIELETLKYKNEFIKLTKKEKILMRLLIDAKGKIVPNEIIFNELYSNDNKIIIDENKALKTLLYRFREKLEINFIETIHSIGLKLIYN